MAFCKNCGTDLNGAKFCPNCGTADGDLVVQQPNYAAPQGNTRFGSLDEMEKMQQYFGSKKEKYNHLDAVIAKLKKEKSKLKIGWLVLGILMALLVWNMATNGMLWIGVVFFAAVDLGMFAMFVITKKKQKEKIAQLQIEQATVATELSDHYKAYGYCPVGIEYTEPSILSAINDVIRQGRADTPKEAINILKDDMHKEKMEQEAKRTADAAQATAAYAAQAAYYSKECARAARKAANYAALGFWL